MIKIIVDKEPMFEPDFQPAAYSTHSEFILDEEARTDDALYMLMDALLLEGYHKKSIIRAMTDIAEELKED